MSNPLAIETFDTSVLADAIFGEDNELIFLTDEREESLYADAAEDYDDEFDFPEDYGQDVPTESNYNLGWGTIEGEIFNSQWD